MSRHALQLATKRVRAEFPGRTTVRGMGDPPDPLVPQSAVRNALNEPIGAPPLSEMALRSREAVSEARAVVVVSDHTRPVPYRGEDGLLVPLLETLGGAGYSQEAITVLVGAGSHRNMDPAEIEEMLGLEAHGFGDVRVENHEYANPDHLADLGRTERGTPVQVNRRYLEADLKIVTGLVESHFMAGASGGRKGICPGIVGRDTLTAFHGAEMLSSPHARDLALDRNPLHAEAREVARMAGCDFLLNVTLDGAKNLTGVFAGDLEEAHRAAVAQIEGFVTVPLEHPFDVVVVPGSYVSVNHYQSAKAAVQGARAVRPGGYVIVAAEHTDPDPIGGEGYKEALALLERHGPEGFLEAISEEGHAFIQEQWQVQMWCKVLRRVEDPAHLIHCALEIPSEAYESLPGRSGPALIEGADSSAVGGDERMRRMVERALETVIEEIGRSDASILLLEDGPYGIPRVREREADQIPEEA